MDLLKQLKDRFSDDELAMEVLFDEVCFWLSLDHLYFSM